MEDLFGNPVEEVVHDDAAEIRRNLADALAFMGKMEEAHGKGSPIANLAREHYQKLKKEAGK